MNTTETYDLEAEDALLGDLLLRGNTAVAEVAGWIESSDIYRDRNQWIYHAIQQVFARGEPVNQVSVAWELKRHDRLDALGGYKVLGYLILDAPPGKCFAEYYAQHIKQLAMIRNLQDAGEEISELGTGDAQEMENAISAAMQRLSQVSEGNDSTSGYKSFAQIAGESSTRLLEMFESNFMPGITTGFHQLNRALGGYQRGRTYIVAARPSMGKSQFMMQSVYQIAREGYGVGIVSLEETRQELYDRVIFPIANISQQQLRNDMLDNKLGLEQLEEYKHKLTMQIHNETMDLPIWVDDTAGQTTGQVQTGIFNLLQRHPEVKVLWVDHIGWLKDLSNEANVKRMDEISKNLQDIAKQLNIPVVELCQLSRAVESRPTTERRPKLHDLRDSGGLEQNAHVVMMLYRDEFYNPDTALKNQLEVIYEKNRTGARGHKTTLYYDERIGLITDWR